MRTNAAKAVGVKIDSTVAEYREGVLRAAEDADNKITQIKISLASELESKFGEALEKMREERNGEDERYRRIEIRTLEESRRRQANEISSMKENILRNRKALQDNLERSKKDDSQTQRRAVDRVKEEGSKLLKESVESHSRALSLHLREGNDRRIALGEKLRAELEAFEILYRGELRDAQIIQKRRCVNLSMNDFYLSQYVIFVLPHLNDLFRLSSPH